MTTVAPRNVLGLESIAFQPSDGTLFRATGRPGFAPARTRAKCQRPLDSVFVCPRPVLKYDARTLTQ